MLFKTTLVSCSTLAAIGLIPATGWSAIIWDEATQGDLSGNRAAPTALTLTLGSNNLLATTQGGEPNFLAIKQQVSQKALELTKKDLEKKEGVEFDKCFVGEQIGAHTWVLATLEVFKDQQISPDLRSVVEKGIQTTQEHLDHAKKLADNLERQGGRETAARPGEGRTE